MCLFNLSWVPTGFVLFPHIKGTNVSICLISASHPAFQRGVKRLGDCLAIFQIKNASPNELAVAFLGPYLQPAGEGGGGCLCRGCCQVFDRIREVYGRGGGVKVVHGYPLIIGGLHDKSTIRGLRDVEM